MMVVLSEYNVPIPADSLALSTGRVAEHCDLAEDKARARGIEVDVRPFAEEYIPMHTNSNSLQMPLSSSLHTQMCIQSRGMPA